MTRLLFLVNEREPFDYGRLLKKHLADHEIDIATEFPPDPLRYQLIILWNYQNIIKNLPFPNNVMLFHSSDLPNGKGWAPLYYAIAEKQEFHVISGIFAASKVDSGDIIVKARFKIPENCTATDLRKFDSELSIMLVGKILSRFADRPVVGTPQQGKSSYRERRRPEDNEVEVNLPLTRLVPHLRACEADYPAYFEYSGYRYNIAVTPAVPPEWPQDIEIIFGEDIISSSTSGK